MYIAPLFKAGGQCHKMNANVVIDRRPCEEAVRAKVFTWSKIDISDFRFFKKSMHSPNKRHCEGHGPIDPA